MLGCDEQVNGTTVSSIISGLCDISTPNVTDVPFFVDGDLQCQLEDSNVLQQKIARRYREGYQAYKADCNIETLFLSVPIKSAIIP